MAKLPSLKRIIAEDFGSSEQKWISRLLSPLNQFMDAVNSALGKGLTFSDNFDGVVKTLEVSGFPTKFRWERTRRPIGLWLVQAKETGAVHVTFTSALFVDWEFTQDGQISILNIPGISPTNTKKYSVTVVAVTG